MAAMKVEFTEHARARLARRSKIKREMVLQTIKSPDNVRVSYRGRSVFRKNFANLTLEVVVVTEGDTIVVVTGYMVKKQ